MVMHLSDSLERNTQNYILKPIEPESRFTITFNQAAVGLAHISLDGNWLLFNEKVCAIFNYSKEELLPLSFNDLTYSEDQKSDQQLIYDLLNGLISNYSIEKRIVCKNGTVTWINLTVSLAVDKKNKPIYFISIIEDINLRKKSEFNLKLMRSELQSRVKKRTQALVSANKALESLILKNSKTQTQLNKFFQLSTDIIIILNDDQTVLQVNDSFKKILGYTAAEIIGKQILEYVYSEDLEITIKNNISISNGDIPSNFENRLVSKKGKAVWISWSYVYIKEEKSIFAIAKDITSVKTQEKMIADQKLKMANVSKMNSLSKMASGIAHEINNPMMVIYGQIYLLKKYINSTKSAPAYFMESLEKIDTVAQRVKNIVNGLRAFSRDGSHDPFEHINILKIIEDTISFCSNKFNKENIHILLPTTFLTNKIYCQPIQISQVLLNLIENSFDAIKENSDLGGWIQIQFEIAPDNNTAFIKVTDSGPGLDNSIKENLFEPFFTTKAIGKGTGLGLSISKSIMLLNNGDLYIDETSINTTFVMKIPM
ncbi:MAG: PAS domain S-box protein [Pseudobdellovibrio sp.]